MVAELAAQGFLVRVGERIVLTPRGRLLASDVTARLLLAGAPGAAPDHPVPLALGTIEC